jgi:hypothetical protein
MGGFDNVDMVRTGREVSNEKSETNSENTQERKNRGMGGNNGRGEVMGSDGNEG